MIRDCCIDPKFSDDELSFMKTKYIDAITTAIIALRYYIIK